jgi:hypothetical protein
MRRSLAGVYVPRVMGWMPLTHLFVVVAALRDLDRLDLDAGVTLLSGDHGTGYLLDEPESALSPEPGRYLHHLFPSGVSLPSHFSGVLLRTSPDSP